MAVASADILVAGAGPAGVAAALSSARRGLEVLLVDRAQFPRDKPCGEGLTPAALAALSELRLLAAARALGVPLEGIGFAFADGSSRRAEASFIGLGVERRLLDQLLAESARREPGITVLTGVEVERPLREHGRVIGAVTSVGPLRARALVCADGLRSRLREQLGLARATRRRARLGLRAHYRVGRLPFGRTVQVLLDGTVELYLTPVARDRLQVAMLGPRLPGAADFHDVVRRRLALELEPLDRPLGAGPFEQQVRSVITDGALLCGDAAGYVDAITGEGVGLALQQGLAAGEALSAALRSGDATRRTLVPYAAAHRRIVGDADRLTRLTLFLVEHPGLARRALSALSRRPALFSRLLSVQAGAPLATVGVTDWLRLLTG
jgi:flavin-dependent dehydrogenase